MQHESPYYELNKATEATTAAECTGAVVRLGFEPPPACTFLVGHDSCFIWASICIGAIHGTSGPEVAASSWHSATPAMPSGRCSRQRGLGRIADPCRGRGVAQAAPGRQRARCQQALRRAAMGGGHRGGLAFLLPCLERGAQRLISRRQAAL